MKPGDIVLCVDDAHHNEFKGAVFSNWIKKGTLYTIREIFDNEGIGEDSVLLEEVQNKLVYIPVLDKFREPSFRITRFEKALENEVVYEKRLETIQIYVN